MAALGPIVDGLSLPPFAGSWVRGLNAAQARFDLPQGPEDDSATLVPADIRVSEVITGEISGIVTILFTDIEGSTRLWEREPEQMRPALARHDSIARAAVEGHGGIVVKSTGDGIHAIFENPLDAVEATLTLQQTLLEFRSHYGDSAAGPLRAAPWCRRAPR